MSDYMVDQKSYFTGQIDAIDELINRQQQHRECLMEGMKKVIDIVIDDSIDKLRKIQKGLNKKLEKEP